MLAKTNLLTVKFSYKENTVCNCFRNTGHFLFCIRSFALQRKKTEKDMQNADFTPPSGKISADAHAGSIPQTNHPKSAQNSEKSNYYQRVLTEELLQTFSFGHHSRQVANSGSGKMVIARYRNRYFFQKKATLPLTLLENYLATVARYCPALVYTYTKF